MAQKWIYPYRRYKKNYEDIGGGLALEHDIGFSGDKLYQVMEIRDSGKAVPDLIYTRLGLFRKRSDAIKAAKTLRKGNPGIERGKWIPAHAVKFNKDGGVSILY